MSIRAYRLLRNNKEQGPFTAEELIRQNLKPYDLIWVDGRSAAWRYPGEMQEFKSYTALPGEQNLPASRQTATAISSSVQAAITINDNIVQPSTKQKPRYKVSAAWSKIQTITTPVHSDVLVAEPQKTSSKKHAEIKQAEYVRSKSLSWEEAWLDWEKEKKSVNPIAEPGKKIPAIAPQKKSINEKYIAPVLETKYAEPLDSLKDKYIENIILQKQKAKKGVSLGKASEFVIPTIALLVIFSAGYWLMHGNSETAAALGSAQVKSAQPVTAPNTDKSIATNNNTEANAAPQNVPGEKQNVSLANEPVITDQAEERKTAYVHPAKLNTSKKETAPEQTNKLPSIQTVLPGSGSTVQKKADNPLKQFDPSVINNVPRDNANNNASSSNTGDLNADENRPVRRRTNTGNETADQSSQQNEPAPSIPAKNIKTTAGYVNVPEYIELNDGSANVKIQNVSDIDLDLVVVDVQYFDASSRFRKGETLYLHNLKAGKNIIVKTPKDVNSLYATSKVSLVSSDAKQLYVVGDN